MSSHHKIKTQDSCPSFSQVIAIDGPSGSGKSSMARALAKKLGLLFIDTGAMFRALAFWAHAHGIDFQEGERLSQFLDSLALEYCDSETHLIAINGENLTTKIRSEQVSLLASFISQLPSVRNYLLGFQRSLVRENLCVMEGRDIGSVVFPHAFCKFFITASPEVRALRRLDQLKEGAASFSEELPSYEKVLEDVVERDRKDTQREVAPLMIAPGSFVVETSEMSFDEVLNLLCDRVKMKAEEFKISL